MRTLILSVVVALLCAQADASLIGLTKSTPDIFSDFITVSYNASSKTFTAQYGSPETLDTDKITSHDSDIINGSFTITAAVNNSGQATSGTLTIDGTIPSRGYNSGTLLTGTLTQFGYQNPPGGQVFDFIFTVTGGDMASLYGSKAGVNLSYVGNDFKGVFTSNFSNTGMGETDTFSVPEPASMMVLAGGLLCAAIRRRRKA